jgi:hypothetical protein
VSLIFEALKKLEREKHTPERGLVVVGQLPWRRARRRWPFVVGGLVAVAAAVLVLARPAARQHTTAPTPAAASGTTPSPPPPLAAPPERPPLAQALPRASAAPAAEAASPPAHDTDVPHETPTPVPRELRLNAITLRDGRPLALLNDRLVREGDSFDGIRVVRIGEAEVEVEVDGERRVVGF